MNSMNSSDAKEAIKNAIKKLIEKGYQAQVKDLCSDIGKAYYAGLTEGKNSRYYRYVCESMTKLNRLYKKEFGEFISPKYGDSKEEMYAFASELVKLIWT